MSSRWSRHGALGAGLVVFTASGAARTPRGEYRPAMDSAEALDTVFVIPLGAPQSGRAPLTDRAILRSASIAAAGGVGTIMFTGEALRRRGIVALVEAIHELPAATGPMRVVLSTDGIRLPALGRALAGAGLTGLAVHLDTLRRDRFAALTGEDRLGDVLDGLRAAGRLRFEQFEVRSHLRRGVNEDEVRDLVEFAWSVGAVPVLQPQAPAAASEIWSRRRVIDHAAVMMLVAAAFDIPGIQCVAGTMTIGTRVVRIVELPMTEVVMSQ